MRFLSPLRIPGSVQRQSVISPTDIDRREQRGFMAQAISNVKPEPSRRGIIAAVRHRLVLILATAAALTASATASSQSTRATLRLVDESPVTFRGAGFHARENVRLVVVGGKRAVKTFAAGAGGGFVVRMAGFSANECKGLSATATGSDGSQASYKRAPGMCPVPIQP
jgi:hypothetical protein